MAAVTKPPVEERKKDPTLQENRQRRLFKKRRAGVVLSREEVKAIQAGRQKLRREMRARGIHSRKEFELTASSLGLYFDKNRFWGLLLWLFHGRGLWALLGALALLMLALFLFSLVSQLRGHFTINLMQGMFREGFTLSETKGFEAPTTRLFADPAEDIPCVSVMDIAREVIQVDGQYEGHPYFAYTFYIRNEGENTADYEWDLTINSESKRVPEAAWFMIFEDDQMRMFAHAGDDGKTEALPAIDDNTRGYRVCPFADYAKDPDRLFDIVRLTESGTYYRLMPEIFETDTRVASGLMTDVEVMESHKYTVVIWLEGDDPDCTDDKIAGHLGVEMNFRLVSDIEEDEDGNWWNVIWRHLIFWE